ncbi:hypothetical protein [Deinococcus frigens]|uniref:hypothetical protein n=1 Tax=Deinococcus frigens TaxID=249403 RepID=UPI000494DB93|nr:hypothetical protein [Deinococcus frigens]
MGRSNNGRSCGAQAAQHTAQHTAQVRAGALFLELLLGETDLTGAAVLGGFPAQGLGALLAALKVKMHGVSWEHRLPLWHPWVRR